MTVLQIRLILDIFCRIIQTKMKVINHFRALTRVKSKFLGGHKPSRLCLHRAAIFWSAAKRVHAHVPATAGPHARGGRLETTVGGAASARDMQEHSDARVAAAHDRRKTSD